MHSNPNKAWESRKHVNPNKCLNSNNKHINKNAISI